MSREVMGMAIKRYGIYCVTMFDGNGKPCGAIFVNAHNKETAIAAAKIAILPDKHQMWKARAWEGELPKTVKQILQADDVIRKGSL